jgi:hypothetical protein
MRISPIMLFGILLLAAAIMVSSLCATLPPLVAVHFDAAGVANGFAPREGVRNFMFAFTLGAPLFIAAVTGLLPRLLPASMINIPNRGYWLAPDRAADSVAFMSDQGVWFGCIFLIFLGGVDWMVVKANASHPPGLDSPKFIAMLIAFFIAIASLMVRMFRRFRAP